MFSLNILLEAREVVQRLRAFTALQEDLSSIPSNYWSANKAPVSSAPENIVPSSGV